VLKVIKGVKISVYC